MAIIKKLNTYKYCKIIWQHSTKINIGPSFYSLLKFRYEQTDNTTRVN